MSECGTIPVDKDELTTVSKTGASVGRQDFTSDVGSGSREQLDERAEVMSLEICCIDGKQNSDRVLVGGGNVDQQLSGCDGEDVGRSLCIESILLCRKSKKCWQ